MRIQSSYDMYRLYAIHFPSAIVSAKCRHQANRPLQVTVTGTQDPNLPPIIQDMKLYVSPAMWIIEYPTDYITISVIVSVAIALWSLLCVFGYMLDKAACESVHVDKNGDADAAKSLVMKFQSANLASVRMILLR